MKLICIAFNDDYYCHDIGHIKISKPSKYNRKLKKLLSKKRRSDGKKSIMRGRVCI